MEKATPDALVGDIPEDLLNLRKAISFVKLPFVMSFYYLLRFDKYLKAGKVEDFYQDCIKQTIREGGDTDTTACIVGGMVGALVGLKNMPKMFKDRMTEFDCEAIHKDMYK